MTTLALKLRNIVLAVIVVAVGLALYDATDGGGGKEILSRNERAIEIRFITAGPVNGKPIRLIISGKFGPIPFDRGGKGNGYVERGVARVGDEVHASLWIDKDSPRGLAVCGIWQISQDGTAANITESTAGPDGFRDFTCWAQVKR